MLNCIYVWGDGMGIRIIIMVLPIFHHRFFLAKIVIVSFHHAFNIFLLCHSLSPDSPINKIIYYYKSKCVKHLTESIKPSTFFKGKLVASLSPFMISLYIHIHVPSRTSSQSQPSSRFSFSKLKQSVRLHFYVSFPNKSPYYQIRNKK